MKSSTSRREPVPRSKKKKTTENHYYIIIIVVMVHVHRSRAGSSGRRRDSRTRFESAAPLACDGQDEFSASISVPVRETRDDDDDILRRSSATQPRPRSPPPPPDGRASAPTRIAIGGIQTRRRDINNT